MIRSNRRAVLAASGAFLTALSGCAGADDVPGLGEEGSAETPTTPTRTPPEFPMRGRDDPASIEREIQDEPGYDDDFEYFPSNETVQVVFLRSGDSVDTEPKPFEEWAMARSLEIGEEHLDSLMEDRLGHENFFSRGMEPSNPFSEDSAVIGLFLRGTVPEMWGLAESAPRSLEVALTVEGDESAHTFPVFLNARREESSD